MLGTQGKVRIRVRLELGFRLGFMLRFLLCCHILVITTHTSIARTRTIYFDTRQQGET